MVAGAHPQPSEDRGAVAVQSLVRPGERGPQAAAPLTVAEQVQPVMRIAQFRGELFQRGARIAIGESRSDAKCQR
jgi:hypothetical protein